MLLQSLFLKSPFGDEAIKYVYICVVDTHYSRRVFVSKERNVSVRDYANL